jgi:hypothetical protein
VNRENRIESLVQRVARRNVLLGWKEGGYVGYVLRAWDDDEGEGNFVDGKLEGKIVEYFESGNVMTERNYVDGKREGTWVMYYEHGTMMREGNFVDGKLEGKLLDYDEEGTITDEDIFEDDECIEKCEGDE